MNEPNLVELTAEIVSAFVSNNKVAIGDLAEVIASTHASLGRVMSGAATETAETLTPAVSIKKSQTPDYLISLEDGKRYKSLKRHLGGLGLSPEAYRSKWGLPSSYPMVAPNYAKLRSELAKNMGLGRARKEPEPAPVEVPAAPAPKRTRKPKSQPAN